MISRMLQTGIRVAALWAATSLSACELCAIYRAADARGDYGSGFTFTTSAQFIPLRTEQFNGTSVVRPQPDYLDRWMFHFVGGWNISERWGVSMNLPVVQQTYRRVALDDLSRPHPLRGEDTGLGDLSVIGRYQLWNHSGMKAGGSLELVRHTVEQAARTLGSYAKRQVCRVPGPGVGAD